MAVYSNSWPAICSLVPRPPRPAFVACSTKSGRRPGRTYHVMRAATDVMFSLLMSGIGLSPSLFFRDVSRGTHHVICSQSNLVLNWIFRNRWWRCVYQLYSAIRHKHGGRNEEKTFATWARVLSLPSRCYLYYWTHETTTKPEVVGKWRWAAPRRSLPSGKTYNGSLNYKEGIGCKQLKRCHQYYSSFT